MAGNKFRFSYVPPIVPGEVLSAWIAKLAVGQGVCGSTLVGRGPSETLDWHPPAQLLATISAGSGVSVRRLRAMTLAEQFPEAAPEHFARWALPPFPGCHAFCPVCAQADVKRFGVVVQRGRDAWLGQLACELHLCFLDGVDREDQITPAIVGLRQGSLGLANTQAHSAPTFILEFQRTWQHALTGRPPGKEWFASDAVAFLRTSLGIAQWLCTEVRLEARNGSPLSRLLWWWGRATLNPSRSEDHLWVSRMPVRARTQVLSAAALLAMRPETTVKLRGELLAWPGQRWGFANAGTPLSPWDAAITGVTVEAKHLLLKRAESWCPELRIYLENVCTRYREAVRRPLAR